MKTLIVVGLNHKTAPLEIRESLGFSASGCETAIANLKKLYPDDEFVILSTCNRVEIYVGSMYEKTRCSDIVQFLSQYHNVAKDDIIPFIYVYEGLEALTHLFEVAAGLDSLVIGEVQILGQMKASYKKALELGASGKIVNMAFQKAFNVAKKVRTLTGISAGNVSISSVSCQLADEMLDGLSGKDVLLIGTGKVGALTLDFLRNKDVNTVLVSSRNYAKAQRLAADFNGKAIRFEDIEDFIGRADIVISSTSAPHYVVRPNMVKKAMARREGRSIFLIDLAVPRDIDPVIGKMKNVHLYNIDSLKRIAQANIKQRENEIFWCKEIVREKARYFIQKFNVLSNTCAKI